MQKRNVYTMGFAICVAAILCACTTVQQPGQSPKILQDDIRGGVLVSPGDRVAVVAADGRELVFRVTEVNENALVGIIRHRNAVLVATLRILPQALPELRRRGEFAAPDLLAGRRREAPLDHAPSTRWSGFRQQYIRPDRPAFRTGFEMGDVLPPARCPRFVHGDGPREDDAAVGEGWATRKGPGLIRAMFGSGEQHGSREKDRQPKTAPLLPAAGRHRVSHRLTTAAVASWGIAAVDSRWKTLSGMFEIVVSAGGCLRTRLPDPLAMTAALKRAMLCHTSCPHRRGPRRLLSPPASTVRRRRRPFVRRYDW